MAKDYDRIRYDAQGNLLKGAGRVAFLARIDEIIDMLQAGGTRRMVYLTFAGQVGIGYRQFNDYINRFTTAPRKASANDLERQRVVTPPIDQTVRPEIGRTPEAPIGRANEPEPRRFVRDPSRTFHFDPARDMSELMKPAVDDEPVQTAAQSPAPAPASPPEQAPVRAQSTPIQAPVRDRSTFVHNPNPNPDDLY